MSEKLAIAVTTFFVFSQICNHPSLIKKIIDTEAKETAGLEASDDNEDIISKMTNMSICQGENGDNSNSYDVENEIKDNVLVPSNPVFQEEKPSSKILTVIQELKELKHKYEKDRTKPFEKAIIVSQWTSMLNVVKVHVQNLGLRIAEINGKHKIKLNFIRHGV